MNNNPPNPSPAGGSGTAGSADETDYNQPVAYDNQGRPLYAHPPNNAEQSAVPSAGGSHNSASPAPADPQAVARQAGMAAVAPELNSTSHQYVHISRPMHPSEPDIPPEIMRRHEESVKRYPNLNLSRGEYVISSLKRHWIGLAQIWGSTVLFVLLLGGAMLAFVSGQQDQDTLLLLAAAGLALISFFAIGIALIATYVYNKNEFYLTNESVIQEIQVTLFAKHEQTVSLANIEDASFYQNGILPHLFNYGLIRLSTEGDETTYRFTYASNPKHHISVLNNAVEAFKNGRPVELPGHED